MTQPTPKPTTGPRIVDLVISNLRARAELGKERYGTYLQAGNGRDPALDLYEELLDAALYAKQLLDERVSMRNALIAAEAVMTAMSGDRLPVRERKEIYEVLAQVRLALGLVR